MADVGVKDRIDAQPSGAVMMVHQENAEGRWIPSEVKNAEQKFEFTGCLA
jgi:hypothetical protein